MTSDYRWAERLDTLLHENAGKIVELREHLHAHPEPSGEELETSLLLYKDLTARGLNVRMGPDGCGLIVESRNQELGRRFALRADIDALRIHDHKDVPYRSTNEGVMHACGHDVHTSILWGVVTVLDELEQGGNLPWPICWRAIFQPAEETAAGARAMLEAGAGDEIDAVLALHVDPTRPTGSIALRKGTMTAACDSLSFTVRGRGGHAARPHEANDPLAAAAQLVSMLYQFVPRRTNSLDAVVLTIGTIRGGENPNVIPEEVTLGGTLRTLDRQVREATLAEIGRIARGLEEIAAVTVELEVGVSIGSVYNDEQIVRLVRQAFADLFPDQAVENIPRPSMGSEDFAWYLAHAPGALFRLGCVDNPHTAPGLHTPLFDVEPQALAVGARVLAHSVVRYFESACSEQESPPNGGQIGKDCL